MGGEERGREKGSKCMERWWFRGKKKNQESLKGFSYRRGLYSQSPEIIFILSKIQFYLEIAA